MCVCACNRRWTLLSRQRHILFLSAGRQTNGPACLHTPESVHAGTHRRREPVRQLRGRPFRDGRLLLTHTDTQTRRQLSTGVQAPGPGDSTGKGACARVQEGTGWTARSVCCLGTTPPPPPAHRSLLAACACVCVSTLCSLTRRASWEARQGALPGTEPAASKTLATFCDRRQDPSGGTRAAVPSAGGDALCQAPHARRGGGVHLTRNTSFRGSGETDPSQTWGFALHGHGALRAARPA